MSKMNRSLALFSFLVGCGHQVAPPIARGPVEIVKPPAPTPPVVAAAPEVKAAEEPIPLAVVAIIPAAQNYGYPYLYRVGNSVAIVTPGSDGWVVHTLDDTGKRTLVRTALEALKPDAYETVAMIQGTGPDDLWLSLQQSQGRASITTAMLHVTGDRHKRSKQDVVGLGTFTGGRSVALMSNSSNPYDRLQATSQHLEVVKGDKTALPPIPKNIRLDDVAVFPSGKIYGIGKSVKARADTDPWQLYIFESGKNVETRAFATDVATARFVRNTPESELVMQGIINSKNEDEKVQSVLIRASDPKLANIANPLQGDTIEGASDGTLWMTVNHTESDDVVHTLHRGVIKDGRMTTRDVAFPKLSLAAGACNQKAQLEVTSMVTVNDGVWISAVCKEDGNPSSVILHTQKQGEVAVWESADSIIEAHRESKKKRAAR